MAFTPKQHREYRKKLKKEGICTYCHREGTVDGKSICIKCRKRNNKVRDEMRAEGGRCSNCLNKLDEFSMMQGHTYCPYCLERRRMYKLRRNA